MCVCAESLHLVQLFATPWTVVQHTPLSTGFSRQEHWSGFHALLQGIFLTQGSSPGLPCLEHGQAGCLPCATWEAPRLLSLFFNFSKVLCSFSCTGLKDLLTDLSLFHIFYFIWYLKILIFYCLFLVFKNITAFSIRTLYSITFLNLFILIDLGDTDFIGASTLTIMLFPNKNNLTSFLIWTILNKSGDIRYPCLILALRGKLFSLSPLKYVVNCRCVVNLLSVCKVPFYLLIIFIRAEVGFCHMLLLKQLNDNVIIRFYFVNTVNVNYRNWFPRVKPNLHFQVNPTYHFACIITYKYVFYYVCDCFGIDSTVLIHHYSPSSGIIPFHL